MQAEIRLPPTSFNVEVYLYFRDEQTTVICNLDGSEKQRVGFGEEAEPSFPSGERPPAAGGTGSSRGSRWRN
jgi:hypothetical protein